MRKAFVCGRPSATRGVFLSSSKRRVSCFRPMRQHSFRWPAWKRADQVHIALARFEALRLPLVFPIPSQRPLALALFSVFPASPPTPVRLTTDARGPSSALRGTGVHSIAFKISVFHFRGMMPLFCHSNNEEQYSKASYGRIPRHFFKGLSIPAKTTPRSMI